MDTAGYIREKALDFAIDSCDILTRVVFMQAIEKICQNATMLEALRYFVYYMAGYTSKEIADHSHIPEEEIERKLHNFLLALADETGFTDRMFLQKIPTKLQTKAQKVLSNATRYDIYEIRGKNTHEHTRDT